MMLMSKKCTRHLVRHSRNIKCVYNKYAKGKSGSRNNPIKTHKKSIYMEKMAQVKKVKVKIW